MSLDWSFDVYTNVTLSNGEGLVPLFDNRFLVLASGIWAIGAVDPSSTGVAKYARITNGFHLSNDAVPSTFEMLAVSANQVIRPTASGAEYAMIDLRTALSGSDDGTKDSRSPVFQLRGMKAAGQQPTTLYGVAVHPTTKDVVVLYGCVLAAGGNIHFQTAILETPRNM